MLRQSFHEIIIATRGRGLIEFTDEVAKWIAENKFCDGLLTLHLRHTSASLLIQENADSDVCRSLDAFFTRLVRDGDMPAHIRTALTAVNLSLPIHAGLLVLGTWQGIYLWEHRTRPHSRRVALHFIGE